MGGCFRYVQIHIVVAEARDKSIIASAGKIRVQSLAAISRVPLFWDVVSGVLKCASDHRYRYFLALTFLFNKIRRLSRQDCILGIPLRNVEATLISVSSDCPFQPS